MMARLKHLLSVLVLATMLLTQSLSPSLARADDSFDRGEIENALKDFYDHFAGRNTDDSKFLGTDRDRLTRVVARQLIPLEANLFNDIVGHMIAVDYRQSPPDRQAIEKLIGAMESEGRGTVFQTEKGAEEKAAMTVLADTVAVWSVVCLSVGFARSWAAADEMTGFEKFAYAMKNTPEQMPSSLKARLSIASLGVAIGSAHAAYDYLYRTRFDPREALERVQDQVVREIAEKADQYRSQLQKDAQARTSISEKQHEIFSAELNSLDVEILQLMENDMNYKGQLTPAQEDIVASRALLDQLQIERRKLK